MEQLSESEVQLIYLGGGGGGELFSVFLRSFKVIWPDGVVILDNWKQVFHLRLWKINIIY